MIESFPVVCIMGPTASGKTDLSLALAEKLPIEIINVDSAQIYREMDIGSGKPDKAILQSVPHHLINILDPKEAYSVWQFREDALSLIKDIQQRHKIPVLVGGTMLYFKGLQQGLANLPASTPAIREKILNIANENGWDYIYQRLMAVDSKTAIRLAPADKQRISRALEVYEMTGVPLSEWISKPVRSSCQEQFINIALIPKQTPRSVLHDRIAQRFDNMLANGLIEETRRLMARGDLSPMLPSIRAVGYRQVWDFLNNQSSFEDMRDKAIAATRQLAKRQLTWLRQWPECIEWDFAEPDLCTLLIQKINEKPSYPTNCIG